MSNINYTETTAEEAIEYHAAPHDITIGDYPSVCELEGHQWAVVTGSIVGEECRDCGARRLGIRC